MTKKIKLKRTLVPIDKLVTMAEMGLGAVRPLNKEKRAWINKLKKDELFDPILVTPIKDSGYYLLTDGWHRVQAAKALKHKEIEALTIPADIGLSMAKANKILRDLYAFELGPILFKPTLSGSNQTFRSNLEGALSYFVGNNAKYPMDDGFGINSWHKFDSKTSDIFIEDDIAMWMGWVTLTNSIGDIVKVDKSWVYKKMSNGNLKIVLHHSSLPYKY